MCDVHEEEYAEYLLWKERAAVRERPRTVARVRPEPAVAPVLVPVESAVEA